jgi:hypothetical protein
MLTFLLLVGIPAAALIVRTARPGPTPQPRATWFDIYPNLPRR